MGIVELPCTVWHDGSGEASKQRLWRVEEHGDVKYIAFLSYKRVEPDRVLAERLHKAIETYRLPAALRARGARLGRVFRDHDELRAEHSLGQALNDALRESKFLIVLCSMASRSSSWVQHEVESFSATAGHGRVVPVLVQGEPAEVLPAALIERCGPQDLPLAIDLRSPSSHGGAQFRDELLRLIARLCECSFDDLRRRDHQRRVRRLVWTAAAVMAALIAAGSVATLWAWERGERRLAETARAHSDLFRKKMALANEIGVRFDEETLGDDVVFRATSNTQLHTIKGRLDDVAMWDTQRPEMIDWCFKRSEDLCTRYPDWAGAHATRAMLLYRVGRYEDGVTAAERALSLYAAQYPDGEWCWPVGIRVLCLLRLYREEAAQEQLTLLRDMDTRRSRGDKFGQGILSQIERELYERAKR